MKKILVISLLLMFAAPTATYADWVDNVIENAKAGNGTVVESHSSVSTGGQTAASGESVTTGDVSASSHTETRINSSSSGGGSVEVKIETSKNDETKTEEYSKPIGAGAGVQVEVNASATNDESKTDVRVDGEEVALEASDSSATQAAKAASVAAHVGAFFTASVPNFFKKVFSFVWWF